MFKSRRMTIASAAVLGACALGIGTGAAVAALTPDGKPVVREIPTQAELPVIKYALPKGAPQGVLPDGRTYGPAPVPVDVPAGGGVADEKQFNALLPDLVLVNGDHGTEGYADSDAIFGNDELTLEDVKEYQESLAKKDLRGPPSTTSPASRSTP